MDIPPYESLVIGIHTVGTSSPRDGRLLGSPLVSHSLVAISVRVRREVFDDMLKSSGGVLTMQLVFRDVNEKSDSQVVAQCAKIYI